MELHAYWALTPDELGKDFEWRVVHRAGAEEKTTELFPLKSDKKHHRYRVQGFPILLQGELKLMVEWRRAGTDGWSRCSAFWPIKITLS